MATSTRRGRKFGGWAALLMAGGVLLHAGGSKGEIIRYEWITKDTSEAKATLEVGESFTLPRKGGGNIVLECKSGNFCTWTLRDFKSKGGIYSYDNKVTGLQTIQGTVDHGFGRVEITTTGDLEGLFSNVTVPISLVGTGVFTAIVGMPGDQLSQGGSIAYTTNWFSDDPIGIDPVTGDDIILGNFLLNASPPLTAFEYNVGSSGLINASFSMGETYGFSSGLNVAGTVSKQFATIPEPGSVMLLGTAIAGLGLLRRQRRM